MDVGEGRPRGEPSVGGVPDRELARLADLLGRRVSIVGAAPWGFTNRTFLAELDGGDRVVIQYFARPGTAAARLRVERSLRPALATAGIVVPEWIAVDVIGRPPVIVSRHAHGRAGAALLDDPSETVALARLMGALLPRFAAIPVASLRLPSTWARPDHLAGAATRWLERAGDTLSPSARRRLRATIARVPELFADRASVVAHGDFAPVNILVEDDGSIGALLDLEFARLADPLHDAAWWEWIVRHHHPAAWAIAADPFHAAAGIPRDRRTRARIRSIQLLRLLAALDASGTAGGGIGREAWADRVTNTLAWAE